MPTPGEYKTVEAHIVAYAQEIGWTYVPRCEAENRHGFDHPRATRAEQGSYGEGMGSFHGGVKRLGVRGGREQAAGWERRIRVLQ